MKIILILGSSIKSIEDKRNYILLCSAAKDFADVIYFPLDTASFTGIS